MANPPRKASGSNKQKEMAMKPTSPQSKKRVSVGARTSIKGKTATKSPVKCSRAGTRSTHNISTVETKSTHVDPVLETSLQAVPSIGTSEPNAISLADLSREMVQAAQEKGIAVPRMSEIEAEYKKRQANQGAANPQVTHLLPTSVSVALTHIPCSSAIISSTCTTVTASYGQPICSTGITNQSVTSPLRNTPLGILPDPDNLAKIVNWPVPWNVREVRGIIGLGNYYRRFVKDYSKRVQPLVSLTKKNTPFKWTQECQEAFEGLEESPTWTRYYVIPNR